jgi:hypothetical protein
MRKLLSLTVSSTERSAANDRAASVATGSLLLWALGVVAGLAFFLTGWGIAGAIPSSEGIALRAGSPPCHVSGGGCINVAGGIGSHLQATFGGDVDSPHGVVDSAPGGWQHVYRDSRSILVSFSSLDAHVARCRPDPNSSCPPRDGATRAEFEGTGKAVLGDSGSELDANFEASVVDVGTCEGSPRDAYSITIRRGLIIGKGDVVHELSGTSSAAI